MSQVTTRRYRQTPYGDTFTIEYRRQTGGQIDIYCTDPPYNPYSTPATESHLYESGKVCVASGQEPRTLDRAEAIAMVWMDGYSRLVRTGHFPAGTKRVNV